MTRNLDFLFDTADGFFKAQSQIITQVFSSRLTATSSAGATEKFAKDVAKDIFEARIEVESAGKGTVIAESRVTELIVLGSPVRVRKHLISFRNLLEPFFRLFVSRIPIGVILQRKFSVRLFDLIFTGTATDSQQFVIIFFAVQAMPLIANILYMQESPSPSPVIGAGAFPTV